MENIYSSFDQLPISLDANLIAATLGISKISAYNLMHSNGFPTIYVGKRMIVPKDRFVQWINDNVISS